MRPGDFSPGNTAAMARRPARASTRFNEAGGFLPRKRVPHARRGHVRAHASMRPGDFSPGNGSVARQPQHVFTCASMRPGDFSPGNQARHELQERRGGERASMRPGDFSPGNVRVRQGDASLDRQLQ